MINEFCLIFSWAWASGDGWLLAWLLATPPNGELARRLKTHKMHTKQKNHCGHNFIYFHKNTLLIFLFYIFTALHQKFMYNCQVREKYLHVHFFQFHFDEWLVRLRHKGVKKRQLWTQRKQENSKRKSMQRRFEITSDLYIGRSSLSTKFIGHSVTCNEKLSYNNRYAAFVKHFRSRFFFFFISALPGLFRGTRCFDTKWNIIAWRSFTRTKTQAPRGNSRNEQLCSKKDGKL